MTTNYEAIFLYDEEGQIGQRVLSAPKKHTMWLHERVAEPLNPPLNPQLKFKNEARLCLEDVRHVHLGLGLSNCRKKKQLDKKVAVVLIEEWQGEYLWLFTGTRVMKFVLPLRDDLHTFISSRDTNDPWKVFILGLRTITFPLKGVWVSNDLVPRATLLRPRSLSLWIREHLSQVMEAAQSLDLIFDSSSLQPNDK